MSLLRHHNLLEGTNLHPMVFNTIKKYYSQGYTQANFPTSAYIKKLNTFMWAIDAGGFVNRNTSVLLEHLHFVWPEAASVDFGRINIVRPSFSVATGSPTFLSKNGIGNAGTGLDTLFQYGSGGTTILGAGVNDMTVGVYVSVGINTATNENLLIANGANLRLIQIFHRASPHRMDGYLNVTSASPQTIKTGAPVSNTVYGLTDRAGSGFRFTNGTETSITVGNLEADATLVINPTSLAGAYVGCCFGGKAFSTAQVATWNTAIQAFKSSL